MSDDDDHSFSVPEQVRRALPWCPHCALTMADGMWYHNGQCPISQGFCLLRREGATDEDLARFMDRVGWSNAGALVKTWLIGGVV